MILFLHKQRVFLVLVFYIFPGFSINIRKTVDKEKRYNGVQWGTSSASLIADFKLGTLGELLPFRCYRKKEVPQPHLLKNAGAIHVVKFSTGPSWVRPWNETLNLCALPVLTSSEEKRQAGIYLGRRPQTEACVGDSSSAACMWEEEKKTT